MFSFFKSRPTTVSTAIAPLLRAIEDLEVVAEDRRDRIARTNIELAQLQAQQKGDLAEVAHAEVVSAKITAITAITDQEE